MLRGRNMADWRRTEAVLIGSEVEVVAKLVVEHDDMLAVQMFLREQFAQSRPCRPARALPLARRSRR